MAPSAFAAYVRAQLPPLGLSPDREAEIVEELAQQLEQTYDDARADGADHAAAEQAAQAVVADWATLGRDLVNAERSRAEQVARRIAAPIVAEPESGLAATLLLDTWQDARFGLRWLAQHRGFTAAALLTLTLTIGASSAIFSLVNAVLLAPLPFPAEDELLAVNESAPSIGMPRIPFSPLDYQDYAAGQKSLAALAVYRNGSVELSGTGESERIDITKVTPAIFDVLRVQPALGRAFGPDDARPGADTAILSHAIWTRRFGRDPAVVGRTILLDRQPYVVIGVMPEAAVFPLVGPRYNSEPAAVLVPFTFSPSELAARATYYSNSVLGRLAPGATVARAQAEATALAAIAWEQYPPEVRAAFENTPITWVVTPYRDTVSARSRLLVLVLFGTVLLLLLAGCTNLGSLLLALTAGRQRELAVRLSLGAGRLRLARQLLAESLVLSGLGALLGLAAAWVLVQVAPRLLPATMPRIDQVTVDGRVVLFTVAAAVVTALLFGLAPAWRWSHVPPAAMLAAGEGRGATAIGSARMRRGLAVAQCAFAVLLLVPAALLGRTLFALLSRAPGFDTERTITVSTYLPAGAYGTDGVRVRQFYETALERAAALPGVRRAGLSMDEPMSPMERRGFMLEGQPMSGTPPVAVYSWITPGYLEALGIAVLLGRGLADGDGRSGDVPVLANETAARVFWPGDAAIGKRLRSAIDGPWLTVVGIVGDVRESGLDSDASPHLYAPLAAVENDSLGENVVGMFRHPHLVVSTTAPVESVGGLLRPALAALDPQLALTPPVLMREAVVQSVSPQRLAAVVVGLFSLAALAIAAAGLHGILAFGVAQRQREFGIRLALGATPGAVQRLVARDGLVLAGLGLGLGLLAAYAATGLIRGLLVGVNPADPLAFAIVAVLVLAVALVAMWSPAHAATRIDPATTIREA
jgi:putative ABC transport system permease protein